MKIHHITTLNDTFIAKEDLERGDYIVIVNRRMIRKVRRRDVNIYGQVVFNTKKGEEVKQVHTLDISSPSSGELSVRY